MWLRLRQIALVARDIEAVVADFHAVFGFEVGFVDPGVGVFGLENRILPVGSQFLEVVSPITEGTAGGRYLERRGGDGGYMVILQCDEHGPRKKRISELGIRKVVEMDRPEHGIMQLHPKDTGGSFLEIDWHRDQAADGAWPPAGEDWRRAVRTERVGGIGGVHIQGADPRRIGERWGEIFEIPLVDDVAGTPSLRLENAVVTFGPALDGRGEGLAAVDLLARDRRAITAAARQRNCLGDDGTVSICGVRFRLVD